jgi:alkanesulfonate monooxygenase SsuD/methylene tetrahydromethanopterin reductase-like flavin-dependent oxidoreductase (luciferase family)
MMTPERLAADLGVVRRLAGELGRSPDAVRGALFAFVCVDDDGARARRTGIDMVSATYRQDFARLADRYLLLGRPDDVAARLAEYADAGAETVIFGLACADDDRERQLRMLAADVCGLAGAAR